jgi:hypothetical protein
VALFAVVRLSWPHFALAAGDRREQRDFVAIAHPRIRRHQRVVHSDAHGPTRREFRGECPAPLTQQGKNRRDRSFILC